MAMLAVTGHRLAALAPPAPDALLAVGLLAVAQVETWGSPSFTAKVPMSLLAFGVTLPVAWRRRAPIAVLAVAMAFGLTFGTFWPSVESIYSIFALLIACYSIGAYAHHMTGLASIVVVILIYVGGAVADEVNHTGEHGPGDVGMLGFLVAGAWLIGRLVARRSSQAADVTERLERLERERERQEAEVLARERASIARELHDVIAHSVSVMVIQAGAAEQLLESNPAQARQSMQAVQELGRSTVGELRRMLGILRDRPEELALNPQPGLAALPRLLRQLGEAGLDVGLHTEGDPVALPPGADLSAYRIVQEALTNTLRHARPGHARPAHGEVRLRYSPDALELEIDDDGGVASRGDGKGHGLVGMRERAALYGGTFSAGPRPGGGYRVRARLLLGGDSS
jgi:signal transduction histidine kinase